MVIVTDEFFKQFRVDDFVRKHLRLHLQIIEDLLDVEERMCLVMRILFK